MTLHLHTPPQPHGLGTWLSSILLLVLWLTVSQAQMRTTLTPDGTLGTTVTPHGTLYTITGGTRPGNGPNLFHSFDRLSVGTNDTARFTGPAGIQNILSRVTGGQRSEIDGRLQSTIPGANLYVLNPSGVVFGPNATLDVHGSFHVSTADYLRLADGARFAARLSAPSPLSVAPPVAFGFLGPTAAPMTVDGSALQVPPGATLSVVGGDITIAGNPARTSGEMPTLGAPGGRIRLVSVASAGEVVPQPESLPPGLEVESFARLGTIDIGAGARLDTSSDGGGTVVLRGGRLLVDNAFLFADTLSHVNGAPVGIDLAVRGEVVVTQGSFITADTGGAGAAGALRLSAGSMRIEGSVLSSRAFQGGNAGSIDVRATHIALTGGGLINSGTLGPGQGGTVRVTATDTLTLAGSTPDGRLSSGIRATTQGTGAGAGDAGSVVVEAAQVSLTAGAQINSSTFGLGQGGTVQVTATDTLTLAGPQASGIFATASGRSAGAGNAGNIVVQAPQVALTAGAQIISETFGPGQGGTVRVTATDTLTLAGTSGADNFPSGIFADAHGTGTGAGNAGSIVVEAAQVTLTAGAQISSRTFGPGQGGPVRVTATDTLTLAGSTLLGIIPDGRILSGIFASTDGTGTGAGNAGSIVVEAAQVTITAGAHISSSTEGPGQGGPVRVTATDTLTLAGSTPDGSLSSGIRATTRGTGAGAGDAGSVVVEAAQVSLTAGAEISSSTFGPGQGGTVQVTATDTLTLAGPQASGIFANASGRSAGAGNAGNIVVQAPHVALTAGAQINSGTFGPGQGGTVRVTATDSLTLAGSTPDGRLRSSIVASTKGTGAGAGNAGSIVVEAAQVSLTAGANISSSTEGPGQGGTVTVTTADSLILMGHNSGLRTTAAGSGPGGDIIVAAQQVQLSEGAAISAQGASTGDAGNVTIMARETFQSTHSTVTTTAHEGTGGVITLSAAGAIDLTATDIIATVTGGRQPGGSLTLTTPTLTITGGSLAAKTLGAGPAGDITLNVGNFVAQEATLTSSSTGAATGNAGTVLIQGSGGIGTTATRVTFTGSIVATEATVADGGDIQVLAQDTLRLRDSQITTAVRSGTGRGGNILIDPEFVILERSRIVADAFGGPGGNIRIVATGFVADVDSRVSASSAQNVDGLIDIQAVTTPTGLVTPLPQSFARAAELLHDRCAGRLREGPVSRFVLGGRDGVPLEPGSWLPSSLWSPGPRPPGDSAQTQHKRHSENMGVWRSDHMTQAQVKGLYAQARWPQELDVECTQWMRQHRATIHSIR